MLEEGYLPPQAVSAQRASLNAYSVYDLPSIVTLVRYLHAATGYPLQATWLQAINAGNYATWPGLTYSNAAKYYPDADKTVLGHMVQTRQNVQSTKPKHKSIGKALSLPPIDASDDKKAK